MKSGFNCGKVVASGVLSLKQRNICKFTSCYKDDNLSVSCFVLETDKEVMGRRRTLSGNRLLLITEGNGDVCFDSQSISFWQGDLIFGFKNEQFFCRGGQKCKYIYIDFEGLRAEELLKRFNINKSNRHFAGFDGVIPFWQENLSRACENTVDLAAESVFLYTLSRLDGVRVQKADVVSEILRLTDEQFNDFDLSVSVIADELGYNAKYLSSVFKKKMKVGYSQYLRNIRIKYALSLFENGLDSIKNVALLSGFSDPLYFSTVFKELIGISPKEYINQLNS